MNDMCAELDRLSLLLDLNRFEEAERMVRLALADQPQDAMLLAMLSRVLICRGEFEAGEAVAREAIANDPDMWLGFCSLAWSYLFSKRYRAAISTALDALQLYPEDDNVLYCMAMAQIQLLSYEDGLRTIDKALEIKPEDAKYLSFRGMALFHLNRLEDAWICVDQALSIDPEQPMAHAVRGWMNWKRKLFKTAREDFLTALTLNPNDSKLKEGLREAILGANPFYHLLFRYYRWLARLSQGQSVALVFGYMGALLILFGIGSVEPSLAGLANWCAVGVICLIFIGSSRMAIATALLSCQPLGKHLVQLRERVYSLIGIGYFLLCIMFVVRAALRSESYYLLISIALLLYAVPFGLVLQNIGKVAVWGFAGLVLLLGGLTFKPILGSSSFMWGWFFVLGCLHFRRLLMNMGVEMAPPRDPRAIDS
jgi:tetratricopeptide (TPR) repeat protein